MGWVATHSECTLDAAQSDWHNHSPSLALCAPFLGLYSSPLRSKLFIPLSFFFCRCLRSLKPNHIQVVERHVVSVTAKYIHITGGINDGWVAISWSGFAALNEASLLGRVVLCNSSLALHFRNKLAVDFEALISVFDDKSVLHWHTCRGRKVAFFVGAVSFILFNLLHSMTRRRAHLLGWWAVHRAASRKGLLLR